MPPPQRDPWAAGKIADATQPADDDAAQLLRARDALLEALRVSIGGFDVTEASTPALPPEFHGKQRPDEAGK